MGRVEALHVDALLPRSLLRRNLLDIYGVIPLTAGVTLPLGSQPVDQIRHRQQTLDSERTPALGDHHERITAATSVHPADSENNPPSSSWRWTRSSPQFWRWVTNSNSRPNSG
jgi:hypothetical protein